MKGAAWKRFGSWGICSPASTFFGQGVDTQPITRFHRAQGVAHSLSLALAARSSRCDDVSYYSIEQSNIIYLSMTASGSYAVSHGIAKDIKESEVNRDEERPAAQPSSSHSR